MHRPIPKTGLKRDLYDILQSHQDNLQGRYQDFERIATIAGNSGYSNKRRSEMLKDQIEQMGALSDAEKSFTRSLLDTYFQHVRQTVHSKDGGIRRKYDIKSVREVGQNLMHLKASLRSDGFAQNIRRIDDLAQEYDAAQSLGDARPQKGVTPTPLYHQPAKEGMYTAPGSKRITKQSAATSPVTRGTPRSAATIDTRVNSSAYAGNDIPEPDSFTHTTEHPGPIMQKDPWYRRFGRAAKSAGKKAAAVLLLGSLALTTCSDDEKKTAPPPPPKPEVAVVVETPDHASLEKHTDTIHNATDELERTHDTLLAHLKAAGRPDDEVRAEVLAEVSEEYVPRELVDEVRAKHDALLVEIEQLRDSYDPERAKELQTALAQSQEGLEGLSRKNQSLQERMASMRTAHTRLESEREDALAEARTARAKLAEYRSEKQRKLDEQMQERKEGEFCYAIASMAKLPQFPWQVFSVDKPHIRTEVTYFQQNGFTVVDAQDELSELAQIAQRHYPAQDVPQDSFEKMTQQALECYYDDALAHKPDAPDRSTWIQEGITFAQQLPDQTALDHLAHLAARHAKFGERISFRDESGTVTVIEGGGE